MKELNNNQIIFCREYVKNGRNATKAYMVANPDCTEESAMASASRLLRNVKVNEYIKELQDKAESKDIMTTIQKKEFLTKMIMNDPDATKNEKLKALDILNKMDGEYVEKIEGNIVARKIVVDIDYDE